MTKGEKIVVSVLCAICGMLFLTILSFVIFGHSGQKGNIIFVGLFCGVIVGIIVGAIIYGIGSRFEKAKKYKTTNFIQGKVSLLFALIVFLTSFLFGFVTVSDLSIDNAVVINDGSGRIILTESLLRFRNPYTTIISGREVTRLYPNVPIEVVTNDGRTLIYDASATFELPKNRFMFDYDFWKSGGLENLRQETQKRFIGLTQGSIRNSLANAIRYLNISSTDIEITQEIRDLFKDTGFQITGNNISIRLKTS
ncbi:MAG: hypothetical protein WC242_00910 [Candidatus Paceibacterota bacterium]|jgi:hypothetical protein